MLRLEPRTDASALDTLRAVLVALAITLGACAALVAWAGAPVGRAFELLATSGFGSAFAWSETLTRATPLVLTGLSAAVAFRARLFNVGAEGQLYLGALAAVAVGTRPEVAALPPLAGIAAMAVAGALAGAAWLLGPVWLRTRTGVDEVVTTLLLNFVALLLVSALLDGPMKDPMSMGWPQSLALPAELELPRLAERLRVNAGLALAAGLAVALYAFQRLTTTGLGMRAVGASPRAAAFAGLPVGGLTVGAALLSGALAGLAGVVEVAGRTGYVTLDMAPGVGYAGIVVAMLAGLHPLGAVAAAVLVAGTFVGADGMGRAARVPTYVADVLVAVALLSTLVAQLLARRRLRWVGLRRGSAGGAR